MHLTRRGLGSDILYKIAVAVAGWMVLLLFDAGQHRVIFAALPDILLFALLSIGLKRLGFEVVSGIRHSLVGIVDLAALFVLGPPAAALVAALSGALCRLLCEHEAAAPFPGSSVLNAFFTGGLNALMAFTAGVLYTAAGGDIPLHTPTWASLAAVLVASVAWFALDHIGWSLAEWLAHGWHGMLAFLRGILPYSLLIELLPLPFAVLIAWAYLSLSAPLLVLVVLVVVAAGLVLRRLLMALSEERRHVAELRTYSAMGQSLLRAGLDLEQTLEIIHAHCQQLAPSPFFALQLYDETRDEISSPYVVLDGQRLENYEPGDGAFRWLMQHRQSFRVHEPSSIPLPFAMVGPSHAMRSGLYVPIISEEVLIGMIALEAPTEGAFTAEDEVAVSRLGAQAALGLHTAQLYQQEQQRAAQLMAIAEVSRKVAAILDLPVLMADTAKLVKETFGYYHVSLFTVDSERQQVQFRASSDESIQSRGVFVTWGEGLIGHAASTGQSQLANNVMLHERFLADTALEQTRSELSVPLKVEQRVLGVLDVQSDRLAAFAEQDIFVLQTLADQIAIAIEDSRLYAAQQEQAWVSTALLQVADAVARLNTPEEVLDATAHLALMLTGVDRCYVFLWSDGDQAFTAVQTAGLTQEQRLAMEQSRFAPHQMAVLARVCEQGEVVRSSSDEFNRSLPPPLSNNSLGGELLALPLRIRGEIIGALVVEQRQENISLDGHRETILAGIAADMAMGLENARLYNAQREEAWVSTALLQVATMISHSRELDEVIATVVRLTPLLVGVEWCVLLLWDSVRQVFFVSRSHGLPRELRDRFEGSYLSTDEVPLLRQLADSQGPLSMPDVTEGGLLPPEMVDGLRRGSLVALPIQAHERLLGALLVGQPRDYPQPSSRSMSILTGIAHQSALAIESAQLYQQSMEQERLQRTIELAHSIQESFLPECCPLLPGWQVAVEWKAARGVGGDYYDFIQLDADHFGVVIADVSDKGVGAALYMALSRTVVRAAIIGTHGPAETMMRANQVLLEDSRSGMFVSMFYGVIDLKSGNLTYVRAGHNPPMLVRTREHKVHTLEAPGIVLGILEDPQFVEETIRIDRGDFLVMYTDGVTESINEHDEEFGEERLEQLLVRLNSLDAEEVVQRIDGAVRSHTGERPQFDDYTLVVVHREE